MSTLTLTGIPGFAEIPAADFAAGSPLTQADMQQLDANVNFAAVRTEIFEGYYSNGGTVALPVSPADGYTYARAELTYMWSIYATAPPSGLTQGQAAPPSLTSRGGSGQLLELQGWVVDRSTGVVTLSTHYYVTNGNEASTTDGVIKVTTIATRMK